MERSDNIEQENVYKLEKKVFNHSSKAKQQAILAGFNSLMVVGGTILFLSGGFLMSQKQAPGILFCAFAPLIMVAGHSNAKKHFRIQAELLAKKAEVEKQVQQCLSKLETSKDIKMSKRIDLCQNKSFSDGLER